MTAFVLETALLAFAMFGGLVGLVEIGRWAGDRRRARLGEGRDDASASAIDTAIFALFGLLIAFSLSGALDRFDRRRALILNLEYPRLGLTKLTDTDQVLVDVLERMR